MQYTNKGRLYRRKNWGITIVELLICCALTVLFIGMVGQLSMASMHCYKHSEMGMRAMRSAALAMEVMGRDLRSCEQILWPKVNAETWRRGYRLCGNDKISFKFVFRQAPAADGKASIIGFHWDSKSKVLSKCLYKPGFKPETYNLANPEQIISRRILARELSSIAINSINWRMRGGLQFLELSLTVSFSELEQYKNNRQIENGKIKLFRSLYSELEILGV